MTTAPATPAPRPLRVALLGMRCAATLAPLRALVAAPDIDVRAVVLPGGDGAAAVAQPTLDQVLRHERIPLVETPSLVRAALEPLLAAVDAWPLDAVVTACFPWRVPRWLRALPRLGGLNVHPSLLPEGRGPEPVFRALRNGQRRTGVTIHLLDWGWDTGPILAQRPVTIPDELTLPELELVLAEHGGTLLVETLHALAGGGLTPTAQDDAAATYAPNPTAADLTLPTDLPAAWAARFVRAVAPVYAPLTVLVMATGHRLPVGPPVACDEWGTLDAPLVHSGARVGIQFAPGILWFPAEGDGGGEEEHSPFAPSTPFTP